MNASILEYTDISELFKRKLQKSTLSVSTCHKKKKNIVTELTTISTHGKTFSMPYFIKCY